MKIYKKLTQIVTQELFIFARGNRKVVKMKYLKIVLIALCLAITGCSSNVEFSGVTSENVRISFDNFYQGAIYLENNDSSFWMKSYRYIADNTEWEAFKKAYLSDVDKLSLIDFEVESLYVVSNVGVKGFVRSLDIKELTYNKKTFTVVISQKDSKIINDVQNKRAYWINIVKIKKADFPTEKRDWLMIPQK